MKKIFVLLFTISLSFTSFATTCDDVRQLYGEEALDTVEYHSFIDYVDTLGELQNKKDSAAALINAKSSLDAVYNKFESLSEEKKELRDNIIDLMNNDLNTINIIGQVKQLIAVEERLSSLNLNEEDFNIEVSSEKYDLLNSKIGNDRNYINDRYDIGELGSVWPVAVTNNKKVYKGFGTEGSENGVYISTGGANKVLSLLSGIVTKIEYSETYGKWIEIQSGKGIAITYSYLDNINVKLGQHVDYGDIISGIQKDNKYIYIELILDGEYKNPMLIMGNMGVKVNNQWIYENPYESKMNNLLTIDSYNYIPSEKIWDTTEEVAELDDNIISIK